MPVYIAAIPVAVSDAEVLVKVGYTSGNAWDRIAQLQTGCPFEIIGLVAFNAEQWVEKMIHFIWKPYRVRGEWFSVTREQLESIFMMMRERDVGLAWLYDPAYEDPDERVNGPPDEIYIMDLFKMPEGEFQKMMVHAFSEGKWWKQSRSFEVHTAYKR